MKQTISQKAEKAIGELNQAALTLLAQIESENLDKQAADLLIESAQRKAKGVHRAYFSRRDVDLEEWQAFSRSGLLEEIKKANDSFGDALGIFAAKVGCSFIDASDSILNGDLIG